jgi:poly(hydroxyalkanoate) granule-associated protein
VAKLKKTARAKPAASRHNSPDLQARAEHLSRSLVESAQQIWMAGVGAFTRAQGEGSKLFEALVTEGMNIEKTTRKLATGRVDAVRDAMEDRVGVVRERASDTWDRLEKVFEDRVQRALNRLGIPGREELAELIERVDALTSQLKKSGGAVKTARTGAAKPRKAAAKSARKAAVAKAPARKAAVAKSPARKPAPRKAPARSSGNGAAKPRRSVRKSLPKAVKPVAPQG